MKWIGPLFINAGGWPAYVALHNGDWYINKDNPILISEENSGTLLLPLMEEDYGENYNHQIALLKNDLAKINLNENEAYSFPFHVPVIEAFKHKLSHWAEMSVDWVPFIELNNERAQLLYIACQDKIFSQNTRHKVLKVVIKWANEQSIDLSN